ncbi:MAG TPA: toll/interleukin-1 receptor domain-containing protein [Blastocatellia bacterium]|nr:toll/interleukin-1 receptor domain-containing protein [Blastocatellia bacterium]
MANEEQLAMIKHGVWSWNEWRRRNILIPVYLSGANLSRANLNDTSLIRANLSDADLSGASLSGVNFSYSVLRGAKFANALMGEAIFANTDLSRAEGLDTVKHSGPSYISIDTFYKSGGNIPEPFLRGCGVPDDFITFARSLVVKAIEFYSCFISYSTKDEEFAKRLHSRMRDNHLRVWFAPEDIKGGQKTIEQLERAIQLHDRLLLVLSEQSMKSEWVMTEIRKARKAEIKENRRKLFPIRLVDFETIKDWECFDADTGKDLAVELREYHIPDFSNWKEHDSFKQGFSRLLRDLKAEESK